MSMKDLSTLRLVDIDQGKFLEGLQEEFQKAAAACIDSVATTKVKCEIKLIPDKEEASQIKILCMFKAELPNRAAGDIGIIVDGTLNTQMPVTEKRAVEVLNFTGEEEPRGEKPKMSLTK